jgi:four helix bundle protein
MQISYRDLIAWQKAILLTTEIYRATAGFPKEETYGLTSQMRRAGVSIASNIAEGHGKIRDGDRRQFLGLSRGSILEIDTQIEIARNLGYPDPARASALAEQCAEVEES